MKVKYKNNNNFFLNLICNCYLGFADFNYFRNLFHQTLNLTILSKTYFKYILYAQEGIK